MKTIGSAWGPMLLNVIKATSSTSKFYNTRTTREHKHVLYM